MSATGLAQPTTSPTTAPAGAPDAADATSAGRRVRYATGILIDFSEKRVEVDAEVVLREGPLELLACSPHSKEHESIFRVLARPRRIYEALGLIGLKPGKPSGWDSEQKTSIPPSGDRLQIRILQERQGEPHEIDAWEWLRDIRTRRGPEPRPWVFAGSQTNDQDKFAADLTGEVVSVVSFGTELICLGEYHSSDDVELWLEANTERIAPLGTRCTLVFISAEDNPTGATTTAPAQ